MSPMNYSTTRSFHQSAGRAFSSFALAMMLGMSGCGSLGGGGGDDDDFDVDSKPTARVDVDLPRDARMVEEGRGTLRYRTPEDGTLYAYDDDRRTVVWYGRVQEGQEFVLEAGDDRATLDGKTVIDADLKRDNHHQIYFDRGDEVGSGSTDVPRDIPARADLVEDGRDRLSYRATDDGTVYIYDRDDKRLVTRERVREGDEIEVDVADNRIRINDRAVGDEDLKRDNRHEIYFDRE